MTPFDDDVRDSGSASAREPFGAFAAAVAGRLEKGAAEYGDRSFTRPSPDLLGEILEELEDVAGWSYVLWCRLRAIRRALEGGETEAASGAIRIPAGPLRAPETSTSPTAPRDHHRVTTGDERPRRRRAIAAAILHTRRRDGQTVLVGRLGTMDVRVMPHPTAQAGESRATHVLMLVTRDDEENRELADLVEREETRR